ncbi:NADH-quinone oxidoreductase subunit A [bacterium]|nr:NADH-quinone oxidoreductase subunit A [bacterium]
MYYDFTAVLLFLLLGSAFVIGSLLFGWLVRPRRKQKQKASIYECGEPTIGSAWIRFNSRFYNVALVYLLFDVEVVVLVPAALVLRELARNGVAVAPLIAILVFLFVLTLGLAYEWRWGNLDWISADEEARIRLEEEESRERIERVEAAEARHNFKPLENSSTAAAIRNE